MSFDKKEYWEKRLEGKRGQTEVKSVTEIANTVLPTGASVGFDNDGNMVLKNRAYRRQKYELPKPKIKLSQKDKRKKRNKK